jgi:hypothetical protein
MATDPTQRAYRAPCPGCGAPVEFKSAQSTHAVCGYCQSTVVRSGEVLTRLGKMAELFDDHSPLQLMASGRITLDGKEQPFTLIGRLQFKSDAGVWTEWVAFLEDGSTASLGEDNGAYVFTRKIDPGRELPEASAFAWGPPPPSTARATAWPTAAGAAGVGPGRTAPSCRRWASRLTWWSCAAPMARCSASTTATPRPAWSGAALGAAGRPQAAGPQRRIGQGRKRPPVQLPALRRTGAGAAVHHQEPDLRLVQQPH